jgi:hypothetical protein
MTMAPRRYWAIHLTGFEPQQPVSYQALGTIAAHSHQIFNSNVYLFDRMAEVHICICMYVGTYLQLIETEGPRQANRRYMYVNLGVP